MKRPRKNTTRKPATRKAALAPLARRVIAQWGDGPLLEFERHRLAPLTDAEFWKACKTYFPPDLQSLAAAYLLEKVRRADGNKNARGTIGRPPGGIGRQVHELITGPFKWDQTTARRLVAGPLCTCRDKHGFPAERCACGAYARVTASHKQWRRDQRTRT